MEGGARRAPPPEGRPRPGGAGGQARLRLCVGGGAPLPRGVLALLRARGLSRGGEPADRADPPRPRDHPDPARGEPPGARGRAGCHARTRVRRAGGGPHPRVEPGRGAERVARLALVSDGRVEFGTGESSSGAELGGFLIDRTRKREMWEDAMEAIAHMFVEEPFAGWDSEFIQMPPRNVVPKPLQKPHPPMWVACSRRETIHFAARKGIGALSFSFVEPEDAGEWVEEYYRLIESEECVPTGFAVNPNVAVVLPMMLHEDEQTAIDRGIDGAHFFGYSLAHYYGMGRHHPGTTSIWDEFHQNRDRRGFAREIVKADDSSLAVKMMQEGLGALRGAIGTPDQV